MEKNEIKATTHDGGVSEETIQQWKKQHHKIVRIDVVDGEDAHIGYFKRPDFSTVKAITRLSKTDEVEAGKVLFKNCFLGGSTELETDAILFMAVQTQLAKMLNSCMSSLKNL